MLLFSLGNSYPSFKTLSVTSSGKPSEIPSRVHHSLLNKHRHRASLCHGWPASLLLIAENDPIF